MLTERNTMDHVTTGPEQEVSGSRVERLREEFTKEVDYAVKSKTHLWIVTTIHVTSGEKLAAIHAGTESGHLDAESLRNVLYGCYICEEPYAARLEKRKCKGPRR